MKGGMLVCLYGEMREALWPDRAAFGSKVRGTLAVALLPVRWPAPS
jgi:hypothetical protein